MKSLTAILHDNNGGKGMQIDFELQFAPLVSISLFHDYIMFPKADHCTC